MDLRNTTVITVDIQVRFVWWWGVGWVNAPTTLLKKKQMLNGSN